MVGLFPKKPNSICDDRLLQIRNTEYSWNNPNADKWDGDDDIFVINPNPEPSSPSFLPDFIFSVSLSLNHSLSLSISSHRSGFDRRFFSTTALASRSAI